MRESSKFLKASDDLCAVYTHDHVQLQAIESVTIALPLSHTIFARTDVHVGLL